MIYQFGKKQRSNSGWKRNDIYPRKVILLSNSRPSGISWTSDPHGISNSLCGGGLDIFWNHTFIYAY